MRVISRWLLPLIPLIVLVGLYANTLHERRTENPKDRLLPTPAEIYKAAKLSCQPDEFTEEIPLVEDLKASLSLFGMGYLLAITMALLVGLLVGYSQILNATFDPWLKAISYIPPMSLLALVFLVFGIGVTAKVFIIFLAVFVPLSRSTVLNVQNINPHQIWNAQTLGPTHLEMLWLVVRRIVEPQFVNDARILLGTAWVYLISAEMFAADAGLGYRINVAVRNMNVAQILFYVLIIGLLAFLMDKTLIFINKRKNKWA